MAKSISLTVLVGTLLPTPLGCGGPAREAPEPSKVGSPKADMTVDRNKSERYEVALKPLNDSGVTGNAKLSLTARRLTAEVGAEGLTKGESHEVRLHSLESGEPGACPEKAADKNRDGRLTSPEGVAAYGRKGRKLEPIPKADESGRVRFRGAANIGRPLLPLEHRVLVLYGGRPTPKGRRRPVWVTRGGPASQGTFRPRLPVACGTVVRP